MLIIHHFRPLKKIQKNSTSPSLSSSPANQKITFFYGFPYSIYNICTYYNKLLSTIFYLFCILWSVYIVLFIFFLISPKNLYSKWKHIWSMMQMCISLNMYIGIFVVKYISINSPNLVAKFCPLKIRRFTCPPPHTPKYTPSPS